MNEEQLDAALADWFNHRREIDAAQTPAFAQTWVNVQNRYGRAQRRVFLRRIAALAALLVISVVLVSVMRLPSAPKESARNESASLAVPWRTTVLISEWRAPTHFLFTAPDAGFASLAREAERWNKDSTFRPNRIN